MATPYLGQLSLVGFNFPPVGWALAAGQTLTISTNSALFSLLGVMYGGDGKTNFKLPDMQTRVPIGMGSSPGLNQYFQGEVGGSSSVTLALAETPQHTHTATAAQVPRPVATAPVANSFNESSSGNLYSTATSPLVAMSSAAVSVFGGSGPHNNLMPYLGMYWIISMQGVFPPRS